VTCVTAGPGEVESLLRRRSRYCRMRPMGFSFPSWWDERESDDLAISGGTRGTGAQSSSKAASHKDQKGDGLPPSASSAYQFPISVPSAASPEEDRSH